LRVTLLSVKLISISSLASMLLSLFNYVVDEFIIRELIFGSTLYDDLSIVFSYQTMNPISRSVL
jgi:hypothetical protein